MKHYMIKQLVDFYDMVDARAVDNVLFISYDIITFLTEKNCIFQYHYFRVG